MSGLAARFTVPLDTFVLDVDLDVPAGETVAVLGPNGAGKTTLLRVLAGLVRPAEGRIELDGRVLDDTISAVHVPPDRRSVGVVFQDHALFPHLSALDNVAFGLVARHRRRAARVAAKRWLARVGLDGLDDRRPARLSGGEAQRVALARALAPDPALLLLDEPLAALDATARAATRADLRKHLAAHDGVRVLVTHDPVDAASLADQIVILEQGRVVQTGTLADIGRAPRSRYAADLVGVNLYRGVGRSGTVIVSEQFSLVSADVVDGGVFAVIHPRAVSLSVAHPEGSPRNVWLGHVAHVEAAGDRARVAISGPVDVVAEVTGAAVSELELAPGSEVWVAVKATEVAVYPA